MHNTNMKINEIHLNCFYKHDDGSICCVRFIQGGDIFVECISGELSRCCSAEDLQPIELDDGFFYFRFLKQEFKNYIYVTMTSKTENVPPKYCLQYLSKDGNFNIFYPRSISDVQLFVQITSGIDISEDLFNYFKSKNHEEI